MVTLYELAEGEEGIILKIKGRGQFRQRLMEMGFIAGKSVEVIKKAPLGDPVEYKILGYHVSLRNSEAQLVEVSRGKHHIHDNQTGGSLVFEEENESWLETTKNINIALVGNPNSGKTTLFNYASGSREKVANYAGVTVDSKESVYKQSGYTFSITDLPGTYSLKSYSPEELFLRNFIFDKKPDLIVNVIDASNLERNMYLTTQLIDMGVQMVIALNMYDEFENRGDKLDHQSLARLIGIPVVPTVSSKGRGIKELFDKIIEVYENREPVVRHIHINYGIEIENALCTIQSKIKREENRAFTNFISSRYLAIELLESEGVKHSDIRNCVNPEEIADTAGKEYRRLARLYSDPLETIITDLRYGFISGALRETLVTARKEKSHKTRTLDSFFTNKYLGIPIFILFMWITFYITFFIGEYPKQWLEQLIGKVSLLISTLLPSGILENFLINGVIGGVGGVLVFIPNIIILFIFISMMEDTGYMARAVFIMDKAMHRIGLHGKSFIPLFMGFGCNVPAIMATRIIESRRDRLITMLIVPFMSCSARLPVYILFISAFFPGHRVLVLFILYLLGVLFAVVSSLLLKKFFFRTADIPFVMELPPYRVPTLRSVSKHVWFRTGIYFRKIGGVILIASVIIWTLSNFPNRTKTENAGSSDKTGGSFLEMIGKGIAPVMKPLGFDWQLSASILSGLAAKEVVVSTLGIIYESSDKGTQQTLVEKLRTFQSPTGNDAYSPLIAFSFMIFILTYFPCAGVIAAIKRESGTWKWPVITILYTTAVAWLLSFAVYQTGKLILF